MAPEDVRTHVSDARLGIEDRGFTAGTTSPPTSCATRRRSARLLSMPSKGNSDLPASTGPVTVPTSKPRKRKKAVLEPEDHTRTGLGPMEPSSSLPPSTPATTPGATPGSSARGSEREGLSCRPPSLSYAHLLPLPDAIAPNLLVLFCGLNPGVRTAQTGHAYSHPSNRFWKLMCSSGILPVTCSAEEDQTLPARFKLGLTNIVSRPSRSGAELSAAEMDDGVAVLDDKVSRWRPEVVCIVGKSIWESVWRVKHGGKAIRKDEFQYGWQGEAENMGTGPLQTERQEGVTYDGDWNGARVFVASSTSGLAATPRPGEKEKIWRELGRWVQARRAGRRIVPSSPGALLH